MVVKGLNLKLISFLMVHKNDLICGRLNLFALCTLFTEFYHNFQDIDEYHSPAVSVVLSEDFHVSAGGTMVGSWVNVQAESIQIDAAGKVSATGKAPDDDIDDSGTGVNNAVGGNRKH